MTVNSVLSPVPSDRAALTQLLWHEGCEVLNPSMPHFRMHACAPACDLIFTINDLQLKNPCPIVVSIKGQLGHGSISLQLLEGNAPSLAAWSSTQQGEVQAELVAIPSASQLILRIAGTTSSPTEFALTYLHLSHSPDEPIIELPADEPAVFPNWERLYQPALLTAHERLRRQTYRQLSKPAPARWHRGLRMMLHPDDGLSGILAASGFYEPHELLVLKKLLGQGDTFIDCGANIGFYSLYAASLVGETGHVLAFEPSPREMQRLQENIALNTLPQITCFSCALSDHEGSAEFNIAQGAGENTLASSFGYTDTGLTERISVPLRQLDDIAKEHALHAVKLIKIDVEGAELHVLRGTSALLNNLRPALLIEVFPAALLRMHTTPAMMEAFLRSAGYRFYTIHPVTAAWEVLPTLEAIHHCTNVLALPDK